MCGIAGIYNYQGEGVDPSVVRRMTSELFHRGPDDEGFWINDYVGLGHRRLAIIDPSPAGHQPMKSPDGRYLLSYNGEIYNFRELRSQLTHKGYAFRSGTDTEVVLQAWRCWGQDALNKFNGMFAFALWDQKEKKLILARDRYGIKPLYYWDDGKKLVFGSEIKAILRHPDYHTEVSAQALHEYFTFQNIFSNRTLFDKIHLLPAAHYLEFSYRRGNTGLHQYWDFSFQDTNLYATEKEYVDELDRLFNQAVRRQLYSHVEIGSYLSGGMDSGAITSIASRHVPDIKTFTAGFDLSSASGMELGFDERDKAEYLSRQNNTQQHEIELKAGDMEKIMPRLIWHLEDLRVGQCYPNFYAHQLASRYVKVVLGGTGGDELFAGYPWRYYRTVVNNNFYHYTDKYYHYWSRLLSDRERETFFQPPMQEGIPEHLSRDVFRQVLTTPHGPRYPSTPEEYINNSLFFEIKTFLHGLLMVEDKLSMANSLEMRVPFLDNDLVDFAMKVPVQYKLRNINEVVRINENEPGPKTRKYFHQTNDGKIILRKVLNRYVPTQYANGVKQGFSAPDASWFKGESIDYVKDLLYNKNARIYEYIRPGLAMKRIEQHLEGRQNDRLFIWSLLSFEWWLRNFKPSR